MLPNDAASCTLNSVGAVHAVTVEVKGGDISRFTRRVDSGAGSGGGEW